MFSLQDSLQVYVCTTPTDMRKSFDSLASLAYQVTGHNPLLGSLFVFVNKRKSMIKILFWDRTGYCQYFKRLESGTFTIPISQDSTQQHVTIDSERLRLVLDGISVW